MREQINTSELSGGQHYLNTRYTKERKKKRRRIIFVSIIVLFVAIRLVLPYFILRYVNKQLSQLEEYYGHVEDIDLALIRGAYVIKDIEIVKLEQGEKQKDTIPFFESPEIDLSVEWHALFKGKVVGEIDVAEPRLNFVKGKHKGEDVKQDTADFRQLIKDLMPLTVNRFSISNGEIHYIDKYSSPRLDISMKNIDAEATNLTNVNDSSKVLPAHLTATGNAYDGDFRLNVDFDGLAEVPTFDLNARLNDLNLVELNDFLKAYGNFDVEKGRFGLYTEFAAKNNKYGGYVKPVIKDLKVVNWKEDKENILWEVLVGVAGKILENRKEEQVATKIPINGHFEKGTYVNMWRAVSLVLRNAFIHALQPTLDHSISINQLKDDGKKTVLEKMFAKDSVNVANQEEKTKKEERKERREERREKRRERKEQKSEEGD